jgi:hypothetical protein
MKRDFEQASDAFGGRKVPVLSKQIWEFMSECECLRGWSALTVATRSS